MRLAMATLFATNRARCLLFARQAALKMLFAVFIYYFNCISFAIRLSGRKVAIKLIDLFIDRDPKLTSPHRIAKLLLKLQRQSRRY